MFLGINKMAEQFQTQTLSQISRKIERFLLHYGINIKRTKPISSIIELKSEEPVNEKEKESLESLVLLMGFKLSEQWKFVFGQKIELIKVFRNNDIKITIDYIGNEKGIVLKKIIIEKIEKVE